MQVGELEEDRGRLEHGRPVIELERWDVSERMALEVLG
jgi:hypothetical protein